MLGNPGQTNYTAAKAGIAAITFVMAQELSRYGVRSNCLAPVARTRLTLQTPGLGDLVAAPEDPGQFDLYDPANISPLVAYLATEDCPFNGGVFHVGANEVGLYGGWSLPEGKIVVTDGRWTVDGHQRRPGCSRAAALRLDGHRHRRHLQGLRYPGPHRVNPTV